MAYRIDRKTEIAFGHEGEQNSRVIRFDVSELPEGIIYLEHLRYGDKYAYPIRLERVGDEAIWIPNETDTAKRGTGRGQLVVYVGDEIVAKTDVFKLINRYSLATTDEVPDGYDSWIQRLETLGADIEGKTTDGLNAINEAKDSALDRISTVSADGIEAINTTKTDSLDAIEQKKDAVHTELDGYVAEHHDELKGEKGEKGDAYIVTDEDLKEIGDRVEAEYEPQLNGLKSEVSAKAEATDLATANRKIKALTDVLNGKELAFETNEYESAKVDVPSGAVADSILKIGGHSRTAMNVLKLNANLTEQIINGVTFTPLFESGAFSGIKINGTATGNATYVVRNWEDIDVPKGTYYIYKTGYADNVLRFVVGTNLGSRAGNTNNVATTFSDDKKIYAQFIVLSGQTVNNAIVYPMLLKENITLDSYEPYFEGIKSSQTDAVGVRGRNLFDFSSRYRTYSNSEWLGMEIPVQLPAGTYTVSADISVGGATTTAYLRFRLNGEIITGTRRNIVFNGNRGITDSVVTINNGDTFSVLGGYGSGAGTIQLYSMQIEKGSVLTQHSPYSYKQIPTNLPILRSAGSVSDERVYGDVKKQYTRIGEVVVDGENIISFGISSANIAYVEIRNESLYGVAFPKANTMKLLTSNGFEPSTSGAVNNAYRVTEGSTYIYCNSFTSLDDAKKMLNDAPITVTYELAEPIITDIDPIPDLEAINVEAGGQISFIDNSDMSFPIPSTHEWVVRNSEV